jgi:hypothetical protein|tara:strand:- start:134 stop:487 length:354 start_codon:yes stop_codon:yes gene_type:complete
MANTYTWDFPQLDTAPTEDGLSDVIKTIHWRFTAVSDSEQNADGNYLSTSAYGTAGAGEVDPDNFVAFDSVTKDWCKEKVLASLDKTEAEMQAMLDTQIETLANPPIVGKTPSGWSA